MKLFEICAEVLVPKFTRAEVRLPGSCRDPSIVGQSAVPGNTDVGDKKNRMVIYECC